MVLEDAIDKLGRAFPNLNWSFVPENIRETDEIMSYWPGEADDDVMVCVLKARSMNEVFHRQDFFFLNFAYRQDYQALSARSDNLLTIKENDCYIGQPFSGYAIRGESAEDIVIIGVLIQKDAFFREYLSALAVDNSMFHFFLDPRTDYFSENMIHLTFDGCHPVRKLLELMVLEYADRNEDTQNVLKPMTLTLLMYVAREYRKTSFQSDGGSLSDQIIRFISEHSDKATLGMIASHFSYHPNYISALLRQETGRTFSDILLEQRMDRALALLQGTNLSVEEVSAMVGYNNTSNFYRAFRAYYHASPRGYAQ